MQLRGFSFIEFPTIGGIWPGRVHSCDTGNRESENVLPREFGVIVVIVTWLAMLLDIVQVMGRR